MNSHPRTTEEWTSPIQAFNIITKMLVLVMVPTLLLFGSHAWVLPPPVTPCPNVFSYVIGPSNNWKGTITVKPPPAKDVHLKVELYLKGKLPNTYHGQIHLAEDDKTVQQRLLVDNETHIKYDVFFPLPYPVPLVRRIIVNQDVICDGPGNFYLSLMNGQVVSEFTLEHTLVPDSPIVVPRISVGGGAECGRMHTAVPLIVHGQNTAEGQWPWHSAVYNNQSYICGGTLVSRRFVVTVAHCVTTSGKAIDPKELIVSFGRYNLSVQSKGTQDRMVAEIHVHPAYSSNNFYADLAVLILEHPVEVTHHVSPICFPEADAMNTRLMEISKGYVVGWGLDELGESTEDLRLATMPVVSQEECLRSYPEFFGRFSNNMTFCAGSRNGTSPCNGDSGGGMVVPVSQTDGTQVWYLRGLVSLSVSLTIGTRKVCDPKHYIVFTDVTKFEEWIREYMK